MNQEDIEIERAYTRETPQAIRFAVGDKVTVRNITGVWSVVTVGDGGQTFSLRDVHDASRRWVALVKNVEAYAPESPAPTTETKPTELVVGRWYVTESSRTPWRVTRVLCGGADVKSPTGTIATIHAKDLTPWVPQVGDWVVRMSADGLYREPPAKVARVSLGFAVFAGGYSGANVPTPGYYHLEPCLPPTSAQAATHCAEEVTVDPCDCPRCTGPVATLLCKPCMGRDWRTWEPEVVRVSVGVESGYMARGRGVEAIHPLRDEAVRLWREKVKR